MVFIFLSCKNVMEWEHSSNSCVKKVSCLYCGYTKKTKNRTSQKIILFEDVGAKWFYIFTIYTLQKSIYKNGDLGLVEGLVI